MTPKISIRKALQDPELLGSSMSGPSWSAWRTLLFAAMGEPLLPEELETFTRFTGRTTPPDKRIDEGWFCVGRRGGKSRAMSVLETVATPASPVARAFLSHSPIARP
jgi:hypothetical protein